MLLIRDAEVDGRRVDVACEHGAIADLRPHDATAPNPEATVIDAEGGALLPGLHDHHIHLASLAAARYSVRCGPPEVSNADELREALANAPGDGWVRGIGYHEQVAGDLSAGTLDAIHAERPVRIQHRSGKMWYLNTAAMKILGLKENRLFRRDTKLRRLPTSFQLEPALDLVAADLMAMGVTGVTDATHTNDATAIHLLRRIPLHLQAMGNDSLTAGTLKIMLDDARLPEIARFEYRIRNAHEANRPVAIHCVTRVELTFAAVAIEQVGGLPGDRIEHASVADNTGMELLREAGVTVVTQPNFIAERGDDYRRDVAPQDFAVLYRCQGFLDNDIPLGGGTDAPFGRPDPWAAMRAAVERRTPKGYVMDEAECLSPERALALFTTPVDDPGGAPRRVCVGERADLCLLDRPWRSARERLDAGDVMATFIDGEPVYHRQSDRKE